MENIHQKFSIKSTFIIFFLDNYSFSVLNFSIKCSVKLKKLGFNPSKQILLLS